MTQIIGDRFITACHRGDERFTWVWTDLGKLIRHLLKQQSEGLLNQGDVALIVRAAAEAWWDAQKDECCTGR